MYGRGFWLMVWDGGEFEVALGVCLNPRSAPRRLNKGTSFQNDARIR